MNPLKAIVRWIKACAGRPRGREPRTRRLGATGETIASEYLGSRGYRVLARNAVVPMGEADLVCLDPDGTTVVIVEVKTRLRAGNARSDAIRPERSITARKRRKLREIAGHLARANAWQGRAWRIDAVAVEVFRDAEPIVRHWRGVA